VLKYVVFPTPGNAEYTFVFILKNI